jgi:hypothetical protein
MLTALYLKIQYRAQKRPMLSNESLGYQKIKISLHFAKSWLVVID